jgi:hypothetical protein
MHLVGREAAPNARRRGRAAQFGTARRRLTMIALVSVR